MNSKSIIKTSLLSVALVASLSPLHALDLIVDDFSSSSISGGARFAASDIDSGSWDGRNDSTWAIGGGSLTNAGVTNPLSDQPTHRVNTISSTDTTLTAVTVSFDYTVGAGSTLYFYSHLLTGAVPTTGNVIRTSATGGATFANDFITTAANNTAFGGMANLKNGNVASAVNNDQADALFTYVGVGGAVQTFSQTYNIADFTGIDSIADVSAIAAIFAIDTAADGDGAITIDNLSIIAVVPEPGTFALLAGLTGLALVMLRRRI